MRATDLAHNSLSSSVMSRSCGIYSTLHELFRLALAGDEEIKREAEWALHGNQAEQSIYKTYLFSKRRVLKGGKRGDEGVQYPVPVLGVLYTCSSRQLRGVRLFGPDTYVLRFPLFVSTVVIYRYVCIRICTWNVCTVVCTVCTNVHVCDMYDEGNAIERNRKHNL